MKEELLDLVLATQAYLRQEPLLPIAPPVDRLPPAPAPPQVSQKLEIERTAILKLEPMAPPPNDTLESVAKRIKERLPKFQTVETVPNDREARQIAEGWQRRSALPEILLLAQEETVPSRTLLANLAKAIALCIAPCDLVSVQQIERRGGWERYLDPSKVKLVIAPDHAIYPVQSAVDRLREEASTARRFLGDIPLLLISNLPRYLHDPKRKTALWEAIRRAHG